MSGVVFDIVLVIGITIGSVLGWCARSGLQAWRHLHRTRRQIDQLAQRRNRLSIIQGGSDAA